MASPSIEIVEEGIPVHVITGNQKLVVGAGEEIPVRVVIANQNLQNRSQDAHFAEHATAREADAPPPPQPPPPPPAQDRDKKCEIKKPHFRSPYRSPASHSSSAATIERIPLNLHQITWDLRIGFLERYRVVAIGPLHRGSADLMYAPKPVADQKELKEAPKRKADPMDAAKRMAVEEYCRVARQPREAVHGEMLLLVGAARRWYGNDWDSTLGLRVDDAGFADMLLLDGCFLLQFMVSMCPDDATLPESSDPLMARPEVRRNIDAIAQDIFLMENQIPWSVLDALIKLRRPHADVPVERFLALMASAFDVGNIVDDSTATLLAHEPPPPHLLGLFHRRQVGAARSPSRRVPSLSSLSCTAVELAKMGVKITASKTKKFGDMTMSKRRQPLGLFGELSLAPVVLSELTMCWLFHMAAYEACQGDTVADNFAVSSYINAVSLLVNRSEDVQELRAKGIVVSAFGDERTLSFFKLLAPQINVGDRYYEVFERLQEYRQERWLWIAVHKFLYKNFKTIVTVLSVAGVLAGLFKTILSLKQPHGQG